MTERKHDHGLTLDGTTLQLVWLVSGPFRSRTEGVEKLKELWRKQVQTGTWGKVGLWLPGTMLGMKHLA